MATRVFFWILIISLCPLVSKGQRAPLDRVYFQNQPIPTILRDHPFLIESNQPEFFAGSLGYSLRKGIFEAPFDPTSISQLYFKSSSALSVESWKFLGGFEYQKTLESIQPYLLQTNRWGAVPYRIFDLEIQPWSGDQVDFHVSFSSPNYGPDHRLRTIGTVAYVVGSFNRNSEPRPLAKMNQYSILLGQELQLAKAWQSGAGMGLIKGQEENQVGAFAVQDVRIFQGRGWGTFTRQTFQSFQRTQFIQEVSGFVFLKFQTSTLNSFTEFHFGDQTYEARDGIAFPLNGGYSTSTSLKWTSGISYTLNESDKIESVLKFRSQNLNGTDPVFAAINFEHQTRQLTWNNLGYFGNKNPWQTHLSLQVQNLESADIAARERIDRTVFEVTASVLKRLNIGSTLLYIKPEVNVQRGSSTVEYDPNNDISSRLLATQQLFYDRSYITPGLEMHWRTLLPKGSLLLRSSYARRFSTLFPLSQFSVSTSILL